jgi:CHAT domain-containing protein/Tfp pilus assembly protein PilF
MMKSRHPLATLFLLGLALSGAATPSDGAVVVEEIAKGSALESAGLLPGDLLVSWERSPEPLANPEGGSGEIATVFDWLWVKTEQAPRGAVRLHVERNGLATSLDIPKDPADARMRPWMAADLLQIYEEGRRRIKAGDVEGGISLWNQLGGTGDLGCWLRFETGDVWSKVGQVEKARSSRQAALAEARDGRTRIVILETLGKGYELANEMALAEDSYHSALEVGETAWGENLQVARILTRMANLLRLRSRLDESAQVQARALEIQQRWAPDSLDIADSLNQLIGVAWGRGDFETMSEYARQALAFEERWFPDSVAMAKTLNSVGIVAIERGRYDEGTAALQRALAIQQRRVPDTLHMAMTLSNLGMVARLRGDLEPAMELHQRALAIWEKLAPRGLGIPPILCNLAAIARERGDLAESERLFRRALSIWEKTASDGVGVAGAMSSLGILARLRGDLDEAWSLHSRSLEIHERLAPGGTEAAGCLKNLGLVAAARGDLDAALDLYRRAQAIFERLVPGTTAEALVLHQLGQVYRRMGRPDEAARYFGRAMDALELQVGRLGGSQDLQAAFRARYEEIYLDAIEVELEQGHTAEAFHLVERSRARSFLALLAERDLALSGELPAELELSRQANAARYDRTLRDLTHWTAAAGEPAREALNAELGRLRRERDEIAAAIRKASPRLAALREPQPLDLAAARDILDPGTLALSYSVGKERTALFAVTREGGLRVEILPAGEERLRGDVERFLEWVRKPDPLAGQDADLARSLYRTLIGPVADLVERSERVLILPDGPLHRLPFGALLRDTAEQQYLAEWKPLHTALSLTLYRTLRASGDAATPTGPKPAQLVAFGDPRYPRTLVSRDDGDPVRGLLGPGLRGLNWSPLPHTRREVERIAEAYPGASLYLGEQATEERAKSLGRDVRILHFATHGYIDDRTPLDSALVLALPEELPAGRENGLLQVWEIFESVRLDADLVVLSACESALGRELSGEGMIGLTRAFQYAGARSVVASLWSVADRATAELMTRFHRHHAAGLSTAEALRVAQIELIRGPIRLTTSKSKGMEMNASAPFYWAAFQLFGDWR